MVTIADLPDDFRARADALEPYAPPAAVAWREAAATLEQALKDTLDEPLDLDQASIESGYSVAHLRRLIRDGVVPNAGDKGAPRILRRYLPLKVGGDSTGPEAGNMRSVRAQVARAVANGN